jgi:hypothetical protein
VSERLACELGLRSIDGDPAHRRCRQELVEVDDSLPAGLREHDGRCFDQRRGRDERIVRVGEDREQRFVVGLGEEDGDERSHVDDHRSVRSERRQDRNR